MSQPEYWSAIARAALPRTASMERQALAELDQFDALDVLKWSNDLGGVAGAFDFADWRATLNSLARSAAGLDLDHVQRTGHVPSLAPRSTYEVSEEQYWEGVKDVLEYALRDLAGHSFPDPDAALAEEIRQRVSKHPFARWPRALDTLRHSQNLDDTVTRRWPDGHPVVKLRQEVTYDWLQLDRSGREMAVEELAEIAMWSDAFRMGTSAGRYVPNQDQDQDDAYWIVDTGGDAFDQSTRQDAIEAAREIADERMRAVFVHRGGQGGEAPEYLIWWDGDGGDIRAFETTDPEVMVLVADRLGLRELGMPIPKRWPPGMVPNIRPDVYWDNVRQMSVRMHYPADYEQDVWLAAKFVVDFRDALDAMRLSSEPGMIGPWLPNVMAPKKALEALGGSLPGEPKTVLRDLTVFELVLAAGRVAAVADGDHWGATRKRFASPAPPLMSLDQYLDYVRQAAIVIARSPNPARAFTGLTDAEHPGRTGMVGHPIIAVPRDGSFPYRALDVLAHTSHPEAIWQDARRRTTYAQRALLRDQVKDGFNDACRSSSSEKAFAWLAAAAFGADILDELSVMGLSKYGPGEVG